MARLTDTEQQEVIRFIEAGKPLPDKYRFFLFESKLEIVRIQDAESGKIQEQWTGEYVFENEWQSFRTKKDRSLEELTGVAQERRPCRRKIAVKVVDIFGNDTMTIVEVQMGGKS
jgi:hypothetical protein